MAGLLISGPAGGGKSEAARQELAASGEPAVILDVQQIYAILLGLERDPSTGRYPQRLERDAHALRLAEYLRRVAITAAVARGIRAITTNSDGDPERRRFLLSELGPGATELVIDPGYDEITRRLSVDGNISPQCAQARSRWFDRRG